MASLGGRNGDGVVREGLEYTRTPSDHSRFDDRIEVTEHVEMVAPNIASRSHHLLLILHRPEQESIARCGVQAS